MKILHIIPSYTPAYNRGGPIWSVPNLNRWLAKKGVDVTVYTTDIDIPQNIPRNKTIDLNGTKVTYFPFSWPRIWEYWRIGVLPAFLPRHWEYSRDLHKALKKNIEEFDLVHITSTFLFASTLGAYYSKKHNKPFIISPRGNLMWPLELKSATKKKMYIKLVESKNLGDADAIHFTVPKEKSEYIHYDLPLYDSVIIPNGIEPENFKSAPQGYFREKFNIPESKKIVLFLGRITWKKGLDTLIPAFTEVKKLINQESREARGQESGVVLIIAGGDDEGYKKKVKKWIKENNIEDNVIFTGMITGKDKTAAYQDSDVFVLPSYSENFGMAVVEAMYMKLPVVVTNNVGVAHYIKEANAGVVISKDKKELTAAILKLLEDKERRINLGENGRKLVEDKFVMSKIADKWVKAYKKIIDKH